MHLDSPDLQEILALASASQVLLMACGTDERTSALVLKRAESNPLAVKAFVGIHPSEVSPGASLGWLDDYIVKSAGIGEVGLDPKYSPVAPRSPQTTAFITQLKAAQTYGKPVQVHSRDAESECLDLLGGFNLKSVLMHWFQDEEKLPMVLERGYFVSFGPSLIYSKRAQRMAARCGTAQVLTETDSPVPYGPLGGVRGPSLVASVVFKLAEVWGITFEEARTTVVRNAARYLSSGEKG